MKALAEIIRATDAQHGRNANPLRAAVAELGAERLTFDLGGNLCCSVWEGDELAYPQPIPLPDAGRILAALRARFPELTPRAAIQAVKGGAS